MATTAQEGQINRQLSSLLTAPAATATAWLQNSTTLTCFHDDVNRSQFSACCDVTAYTTETDDVCNDVKSVGKKEGLLSGWDLQMAESILDCGFLQLFFLIGAPTNVLNMIVFYRQGLKDRMNFCLFSLAFVDFLYVVSKFAMGSYCLVGDDHAALREMWKYTVRKHVVNFMFGALYSSGGLTVIIAVERYVCVAFPMKAGTLLKTRTMVTLVLFTVFIMNAFCSIYAFKYKVSVLTDVSTGRSMVVLAASRIYTEHKTIIDVVENIVLSAITFINFLIVSAATGITVLKLRHAMKWRQSSGRSVTSAERRQTILVKMLVTVSCIYITCAAPTICLAMTRLLVPDFWPQRRFGRMYYVTHIGTTVILMLNSSVNFFVYVVQSSRFRLELQGLFCKKKRGDGEGPGWPTQNSKKQRPASASSPPCSNDAQV